MFSKKGIRSAIISVMVVGMLWGAHVLIDGEAAEELPYICVKGILFDNDVPMALVNQGIVRVGATVAGAKVTQIGNASVQFEYEGETFERKLGDCEKTIESLYEGDFTTEEASAPIEGEEPTDGSFYENIRDNVVNAEFDKEQVEQFARSMMPAMAGMMGVFALIWIAFYAYFAITLQFIARKTGVENGWLAWIPVANLYLMCRIADRPAWWTVLFFIPIANLIVSIKVCMGIAHACNKSSWLGILLFVPVVNLFILGYLAFSKDAVMLEEHSVQKPDTQNPDQGEKPRSTGITL